MRYPHGQGFIAPTRENLAGYLYVAFTRVIVISPSSRGCLKTSRTVFGNSKISSRNSTHLWARLISPGFACVHPPIILTALAVWCTTLNGLFLMIGFSWESIPVILYIFEISIDSSSVRSGRIVENALASIVFPLPGGPSMMMLCHPAAAISRARFACSCPSTYLKSYL